jgi:hypothetical protein
MNEMNGMIPNSQRRLCEAEAEGALWRVACFWNALTLTRLGNKIWITPARKCFEKGKKFGNPRATKEKNI